LFKSLKLDAIVALVTPKKFNKMLIISQVISFV